MIHSMTGYGQAQGDIDGVSFAVEIRTVNNRYYKSSIKLPESTAFLEEDVEKLLRKNLSRGMVAYTLRLKKTGPSVLPDIDETALKTYMEKLTAIIATADAKCRIDIGSLLNLPGIIVPISHDEQVAEQIREAVLSTTQKAINSLKEMRAVEGEALAADLQRHCREIRRILGQIQARSGAVLQQHHKKLKKRVEELLADAKLKIDEETLAREVAVFAERSDIAEEIARLNSHLDQFEAGCQESAAQANGAAGRRLDFISQEMLREANTIASKAFDSEIAGLVVDVKCRVDRIKEQVQNIE
jgi:uncharacterized protein (TIGR00255 family)